MPEIASPNSNTTGDGTAVDGELQINDRLERAALEAPEREIGEQTLDRVESR